MLDVLYLLFTRKQRAEHAAKYDKYRKGYQLEAIKHGAKAVAESPVSTSEEPAKGSQSLESSPPKAVRIGIAGALVYSTIVGVVNLGPQKVDYVPFFSDITPVLAEVATIAGTRIEVISHSEFTRLNGENTQLLQLSQETESGINNAVSTVISEINSVSVGSGEWHEGGEVDRFSYANNVVVNENDGLKVNHIVYSDGLEGLLILNSERIGLYSTNPKDGGEPVVSEITWWPYRSGTITISGEDFEASFDNGKEFAFN